MAKNSFIAEVTFKYRQLFAFNHIEYAWIYPLGMIEKTSSDPKPHAKSQFYRSKHSPDEADSLFGKTLDMSRYAWPHTLNRFVASMNA